MAKQPGGARDQRRRQRYEAIAVAADRAVPKDHVEATLSNGIVLRGKMANQALLLRVSQQFPTPPIPTFSYELDGETVTEENPNDPEYLAALEGIYTQRLDATNRVMWTTGTEVVTVPEGLFGPDDERWVNEVEQFGVEPDLSTPQRRYHDWLTMYAIRTQEDQTWAFALAMAETGTLEAGVQEALEFFRRKALGGTDPEISPEPTREH